MPPLLRPSVYRHLRQALLDWYDRHRRSLPWRENPDPYRVWISEIMLQQTRVAAVVAHYQRFLRRFPDVNTLARARISSLLAAWSGLGYYRRARMMHAAARQIVRNRSGCWPLTASDWQTLPGIGRYTAAAIASICFGEKCAVVDGNVKRVVSRLLGRVGDETGNIWVIANELLCPRRPGDFNQAIMELGATVCTPRAPRCAECPVRRWCRSAEDMGDPELRLSSNAARAARRKVEAACALRIENGRVLLVRRQDSETVMPGLWELPPAQPRKSSRVEPSLFRVRHSIMDKDYLVEVFTVSGDREFMSTRNVRWFTPQQAERLALTGLARKILKRAKTRIQPRARWSAPSLCQAFSRSP